MLAAATKLFPEHGLDGVTVRELAKEAGVNVAAVNYHFGSKESLYIEMIRAKIAELKVATLHFDFKGESESAKTPAQARASICRFIEDYINALVGLDAPEKFTLLMAREMVRPSVAIDMVVEEFVLPRFRALETLVQKVRPDLAGTAKPAFCVMSIVGQCLYYRFASQVALRLLKRKKLSAEFLHEIADHIADFSLSALKGVKA